MHSHVLKESVELKPVHKTEFDALQSCGHKTQTNVDRKKKRTKTWREKRQAAYSGSIMFLWLHLGDMMVMFVWKGGAMQILISMYGVGPNADLYSCIRKIQDAGNR